MTGAIAVFDSATGKNLVTFNFLRAVGKGPNLRLDCGYTRLWYPAGSKYLIAVREEVTVLVDPENGKEVRSMAFPTTSAVTTPTGVRLFAVPKDGSTVKVHDMDGKLVRSFDHTARPEALGFDPACNTLAACTEKSEVRVWDLVTGKILGNVTVPETGEGLRRCAADRPGDHPGSQNRPRRHAEGDDLPDRYCNR